MKRIASLLLTVALLAAMLTVFAVPAFAATPGVTELTNPTTIEKNDKFTVTVQGENYTYFYIEDFTTDQSYIFDPGESCEVTAGGEYRIEATFYEPYVAENLGDWAVDPDSGILFIDLTAGKAGESITVTAPKLIKKIKMSLLGSQGYSSIVVTATDVNGSRVVPIISQGGLPKCFVKPGDTVHISANFNSAEYSVVGKSEGWEIINYHVEYTGVIGGDESENINIEFPFLVKIPQPHCTVTILGDNYSKFIIQGEEHSSGYTFSVSPETVYQFDAVYDSTAYKYENLGDWKVHPTDPNKLFIKLMSGEAGESITITAPTLTEKPDPYNQHGNDGNEQQDNEPTGLGSVLSDGNIWIIVAVAVLALCGVAALIIVKKKKKSALADGESEDEE